MRKAAPRPKNTLASRIQVLVDLAGGFSRFAELTDVSRTAAGLYARGKREPHPAQLAKIADACGVDSHWVRSGEGSEPVRLNPGVAFTPPPAPAASEITPPIDLLGEVPVTAFGPVTILALGHDWASGLGLGGGAASVLSTDETAAPLVTVGEPVLVARVADWRSALPLHPDAIWAVEHQGKILLRRITLTGPQAELLPVGSKRAAKIRVHADSLVVRGRAVWSGARL